MSLDPLLLDLLVCPVDKGPLLYLPEEDLLYNPRLRRGYRIERGIPVLLPDQGETVTGERHAALLARAGVAETGFVSEAGFPETVFSEDRAWPA